MAGTAQAFEIPHRQPDLAIRWDNTIRYNARRARAGPGPGDPRQPEPRRRRPQFRQRLDGHQPARRPVGIRFRRGSASTAFAFSAAGWYDAAYDNLDNTNTATANTLVNGLPVAGAVEPVYQALRQGPFGRVARCLCLRQLRRRRRSGQHQGGPAHGLLGRQPAAGRRRPWRLVRQNSLDLGRASPRRAPKRRSCSGRAAAITLQAQPTKDLSIAGQWFYNWQAVRVPESGTYLTINDGAQLRRRFGHRRARIRSRPRIPGAPAYLRAWNAARYHAARDTAASIGDCGLSARWSPDWLDGTLGFYAPQRDGHPAAAMLTPGVVADRCPAATYAQRSAASSLPGGAASSTRRRRRSPTCRSTASIGTYRRRLRQQHPHLRPLAGEGSRRRQRRRGDVLPPEHAAR